MLRQGPAVLHRGHAAAEQASGRTPAYRRWAGPVGRAGRHGGQGGPAEIWAFSFAISSWNSRSMASFGSSLIFGLFLIDLARLA